MQLRVVVGVVLALTSIAHIQLLATVVMGFGEEPGITVAGHAVALPLAVSGAIAVFQAREWAWKVVLSYGGVVAALILSLGQALQLPGRAWFQLIPAATVAFGLAALAAVRLRRSTAMEAAGAASGRS